MVVTTRTGAKRGANDELYETIAELKLEAERLKADNQALQGTHMNLEEDRAALSARITALISDIKQKDVQLAMLQAGDANPEASEVIISTLFSTLLVNDSKHRAEVSELRARLDQIKKNIHDVLPKIKTEDPRQKLTPAELLQVKVDVQEIIRATLSNGMSPEGALVALQDLTRNPRQVGGSGS